jgi:hypothetical protein
MVRTASDVLLLTRLGHAPKTVGEPKKMVRRGVGGVARAASHPLSTPGRRSRKITGGTLPRPEPLLCGVGDGRIQTHKRSFGIAKLSCAVAPGHHLRLVHHFQLIF